MRVIASIVLSVLVATISSNASFAPSMASFNVNTSSAPSNKVLNAATLLVSVNCNVSLRLTPSPFNFAKAGIKSSIVFTEPPNLWAKTPLESAKFNNIFLVPYSLLNYQTLRLLVYPLMQLYQQVKTQMMQLLDRLLIIPFHNLQMITLT